jgi:hypothetical protein
MATATEHETRTDNVWVLRASAGDVRHVARPERERQPLISGHPRR